MARRKKGHPVHGWVILDKSSGLTSTQAVGVVKRLFDAQKAGHAGTLDPMATGILPIALGEATKTVNFAVDGLKAYRFKVRWGVETNTDDAEGTVVRTSDCRPTRADIEAVLADFVGEVRQVPPAFSAIKVDGNRAYDLARDGDVVELEARTVFIEALELVALENDDTAVFEAACGKGTYVRALARDIGRALGCFGHVISLRRTQVGAFSEDDAITLDELRDLAADGGSGPEGAVMEALRPITSVLDDVFVVNVSQSDAARLRCGQAVLLRGRDAPIVSGTACALFKGDPVAVAEIVKGCLRPTRVFNLS